MFCKAILYVESMMFYKHDTNQLNHFQMIKLIIFVFLIYAWIILIIHYLKNAIYVIQVGFSHTNILRSIIHHACLRFPNLASVSGISGQLPSRSKSLQQSKSFSRHEGTRKVFVIFGGNTSERQVSLMSGTNVWLNLLAFHDVSLHNQEDLKVTVNNALVTHLLKFNLSSNFKY